MYFHGKGILVKRQARGFPFEPPSGVRNMVRPTIREEDIILQGFLLKESRYLSLWRARWFVLTPNMLCSFKRQGEYSNPTECISLAECVAMVGADHITGKENSFAVKTVDRTFLLIGPSAQEQRRWQAHISKFLLMHRAPKIQEEAE